MTTPTSPGPLPYPPYVSASGNQSFYTTIFPPPIQGLAIAYFTPKLAPTPVATRLPVPSNTADTVNGFLRVEAAGGSVLVDELLFNCGIIIHSYAPNNQESFAEILAMHALAHGGNAQGQLITHPTLQRPWYVTYSRITALAVRQADPLVNMTRFRGMVLWRCQGMADPLPHDTDAA
jgi:hypothetical protein